MKNKKRSRSFLKIYLSLLVGVICFFTIYAFRFDVLQLNKKDPTYWHISTKTIQQINQKVADIPFTVENHDKIKKIMQKQLQEYDFQLYQFTEGNEEPFPIAKLTSGIYNNNIFQPQFDNLQFENGEVQLELYPNFTSYFQMYAIVSFGISILICILAYLIFSWIDKNQIINKFTQKLQYTRFGKRLSIELISVNIIAGILALLLYLFMYNNRYAYFSFLRDLVIEDENIEIAERLQDTFKNTEIKNSDNINYNKINKRLKKASDSNTSIIYLYDTNNSEFFFTTFGNATELITSNNLYAVSAISDPNFSTHIIKFKNKNIFAYITSYPLINYANAYLYGIISIAISIYAIALVWFIQNKVKMILKMQEDVDILAAGNLNHEINILGGDEIGELGKNLNEMRISFLDTMDSEKRTQDANKKLITSMSHDLRTPLTSLMGYLDILRLQKGEPEQAQNYLDKAAEKVEQIRALSDQMFEYFLVYAQDENVQLSLQTPEEWIHYIEESASLLTFQDYEIKIKLEQHALLHLNMTLMKRAVDNIFSNLQKYADIYSPITIMSEVKKGKYCLSVENLKSKNIEDVESNNIGLNSVKRIVQLHNGNLKISNTDKQFLILIEIPIYIP